MQLLTISFDFKEKHMKTRLAQISILMIVAVLISSCGLRYSDQGRPLDFLKAKKYKAAKKELVQEDSSHGEESKKIEEERASNSRDQNIAKDVKRGEIPMWAYILMAIFIGPLAIGLYEGITGRFWLDAVLYVIGYGATVYSFGLAGACALAAALIALFVVLDVI